MNPGRAGRRGRHRSERFRRVGRGHNCTAHRAAPSGWATRPGPAPSRPRAEALVHKKETATIKRSARSEKHLRKKRKDEQVRGRPAAPDGLLAFGPRECDFRVPALLANKMF